MSLDTDLVDQLKSANVRLAPAATASALQALTADLATLHRPLPEAYAQWLALADGLHDRATRTRLKGTMAGGTFLGLGRDLVMLNEDVARRYPLVPMTPDDCAIGRSGNENLIVVASKIGPLSLVEPDSGDILSSHPDLETFLRTLIPD